MKKGTSSLAGRDLRRQSAVTIEAASGDYGRGADFEASFLELVKITYPK
jgi:hypothetical protein